MYSSEDYKDQTSPDPSAHLTFNNPSRSEEVLNAPIVMNIDGAINRLKIPSFLPNRSGRRFQLYPKQTSNNGRIPNMTNVPTYVVFRRNLEPEDRSPIKLPPLNPNADSGRNVNRNAHIAINKGPYRMLGDSINS